MTPAATASPAPRWSTATTAPSTCASRPAPAPGAGQGTNAAVLTMGVEDYDATEAKILAAGGQVALPKFALPGMAWQGYYLDTEGNTFGIHQPDESAD